MLADHLQGTGVGIMEDDAHNWSLKQRPQTPVFMRVRPGLESPEAEYLFFKDNNIKVWQHSEEEIVQGESQAGSA